jgi:acylphosphatase
MAREAPCFTVDAVWARSLHKARRIPGGNVQKYLHRSGMDYDAGMTTMICRKCLVGGRVQGVFYRATAAQRARELNVSGYAVNLPDGRVEVLACGEPVAVNTFVEWLWTGSSASKVTSVEVIEVSLPEDQRPSGFRTG